MPKGRRAIVESRCRGGCHRAGREFLAEGLCPPLCHERWSSICPRTRALRSGAALDCGGTREKCFDARRPDGGRVLLRGEVGEDNELPNIPKNVQKNARHGRPCRAFFFSQNSALPTVRGWSSTSRMLLTPVRYMTMRSKPRPKPAWRQEP